MYVVVIDTNITNKKDSVIRFPAETILVSEVTDWCIMTCGVGHAGRESHGSAGRGWDTRRFDHTDGMNLLYCDGHVKWFRKGPMPPPMWGQ
ncbi:MAG TPA: hypothetical protein EYP85_00650 [Armatimonadetes bacterium]|nr:hypothetical protein [Armatimonadota bacterium]